MITFTAESAGERILKIGQHLAKLWIRGRCPVCDLRGTQGVEIINVVCGVFWAYVNYSFPKDNL